MRRSLSLSLTLLLALGLSSGCDSGDGGESAAFSTGLPSSSVLGDLTADEAVLLCEAAVTMYEEVEALNQAMDPCLGEGLSAKFGGDNETATCEAAVSDCQAAGAAEPRPEIGGTDGPPTCDPEGITNDLEGCTATVGDFEACTNATLAMFNEMQAVFTCEMTLDQAMSMQDMDGDDAMPSECDVLQGEECQLGSDETSREETPSPPEELP
jgi:hypothetical protein